MQYSESGNLAGMQSSGNSSEWKFFCLMQYCDDAGVTLNVGVKGERRVKDFQ